ncbi:hypothetical protein F2P81_001166 [Scophthalmus maximus]|uniref:Uncharacterized protein n=1 Tax=Scophthalmus maximus TaxID=52904 RepID=A0A6A4TMX9_SCOMX|nr:hypothetical protein F2P81_001166 [Scophthalmus maximus]
MSGHWLPLCCASSSDNWGFLQIVDLFRRIERGSHKFTLTLHSDPKTLVPEPTGPSSRLRMSRERNWCYAPYRHPARHLCDYPVQWTSSLMSFRPDSQIPLILSNNTSNAYTGYIIPPVLTLKPSKDTVVEKVYLDYVKRLHQSYHAVPVSDGNESLKEMLISSFER